MNKEVVYLVPGPFWERDYHRYGCKYLCEHGYKIEIWSIPLDGDPGFTSDAGMYQGNHLFFLSTTEYNKRIKTHLNDIYISIHFRAEIMIPLVNNGCTYILYGGFGPCVSENDLLTKK